LADLTNGEANIALEIRFENWIVELYFFMLIMKALLDLELILD